MPQHQYLDILKFWRAIETFHLPDIPMNKPYKLLEPGTPLPWEPDGASAVKEGKEWRHTLYFHIVAKEEVVSLLARLTGSKEFREPVPGRTCLSALVVDHFGQSAGRSYFPAAFIYAIKIIQEKGNPEELEDVLAKAQEGYRERFQTGTERAGLKAVDWTVLGKELDYLEGLSGHQLKMQASVVCISELVGADTGIEAPFLNSYYLHDLNALINMDDASRPLKVYLSREAAVHRRYDILTPRTLSEALHPEHQSPGRWPSSPGFGLYSAQQAALHLVMSGLRAETSLMGINGPPGTGKTTLLREVIADVVTARALRLLEHDVKELFSGKRKAIVNMSGYYDINQAVSGTDGIVVASNNNTAVENISKELPVLDSIDRGTFRDAEYFSSTATHIHGKPCWGMLSAVLGKSDNRNGFVSRFWFNKGQGFGRYLKEQYDPATREKNVANYEETARELRDLLGEYDRFKEIVVVYHRLMLQGHKGPRLQELASELRAAYDISPYNLPGEEFLSLPMEELHRRMPYSSDRVNRLRSRIFLLSLELHEWAIKVNARQFNSNLNVFVDLISNKHTNFIDTEIAAVLWNTFFFCIPVVSVTLASFQRQFAKLGQAAIGWLLLDEAGQATPASICGALWRSERAIIIGDTLQIPPVVTIPEALGKLLQKNYAIGDDCWSPVYHSAQYLADRVTTAGTYVVAGDGERIWTGIPLRAHRRCSEPMFSISNTIAYNGQMVKVTKDGVSDIPTGESGWIDVRVGSMMEGHTVIEELQVLEILLQRLAYYDGGVYIISPFRSIADNCKKRFFVKGRVECGTIHNFQGKEAGIVFLVLGTHAGSVAARRWAAQRPNMLNVAVTRAKERLYVIGNREVWSVHHYFDHLAERLPVKEVFTGRLF
ncbi:MAG: ATP-binding protein [Chitinophagaceae bacterium]|nr:ATP-binding protein [Chitinophagaceae bacterium]